MAIAAHEDTLAHPPRIPATAAPLQLELQGEAVGGGSDDEQAADSEDEMIQEAYEANAIRASNTGASSSRTMMEGQLSSFFSHRMSADHKQLREQLKELVGRAKSVLYYWKTAGE